MTEHGYKQTFYKMFNRTLIPNACKCIETGNRIFLLQSFRLYCRQNKVKGIYSEFEEKKMNLLNSPFLLTSIPLFY